MDRNLELDSASLDTIPEGCYEVVVQFIIDKEGTISDVKIQKDPGYGLGKKIVNVLSGYKGWKPAQRNGRPVRSFQRQPIIFILENEEEECRALLTSELIL